MSSERLNGSGEASSGEASWFVCRPGGAPQGPLSTDGVREAILRGILREDAQVCEALGEPRAWRAITSVPAFRQSFEGRGDVSLPLVYAAAEFLKEGGDFDDPLSSLPTASWPQAKQPPPPPETAVHPPAGTRLGAPPLPELTPSIATKNASAPARGRWILAAVLGLLFGGGVLAVAAVAVGRFPGFDPAAPFGTSPSTPAPAETLDPETPASVSQPPASVPKAEASSSPSGTPAHPCDGSRTPKPICDWVAAVAEGREAPRPAFDQLQIFLLEEGFDRTKGRILGEGVGAGKSNTGEPLQLYQATSSGVFGYCLQSRSTLAPGSFYTLWVKRHEGTSSIKLPSGKNEDCVLIEHEELPGTLTDLLQMPANDPEIGATALRALSQIKAYDRAQ